jgi:hypothetical protein
MQLIGIPADGQLHVHKGSCRDIGSAAYNGITYDDCEHLTAESKTEAAFRFPRSMSLNWFPCTKSLRKGQ